MVRKASIMTAVGPPASIRQPKGVHKKGKKLIWDGAGGPLHQDACQRVYTKRASSCDGPSTRNMLWPEHQVP